MLIYIVILFLSLFYHNHFATYKSSNPMYPHRLIYRALRDSRKSGKNHWYRIIKGSLFVYRRRYSRLTKTTCSIIIVKCLHITMFSMTIILLNVLLIDVISKSSTYFLKSSKVSNYTLYLCYVDIHLYV